MKDLLLGIDTMIDSVDEMETRFECGFFFCNNTIVEDKDKDKDELEP